MSYSFWKQASAARERLDAIYQPKPISTRLSAIDWTIILCNLMAITLGLMGLLALFQNLH